MPEPIRLARKLDAFRDHWSPKIVAEFNGHDVMVDAPEWLVEVLLQAS